MALKLRHVAVPKLLARFREKYANSTGLETLRLAEWLRNHIDDGSFTEKQVVVAFDVPASDTAQFKSRMRALQAQSKTLKDLKGE